MKILKRNKGQTLIETAFVLFILMLIALGTVEFARAWFTKNSMKNASRHGARIAVVTDGITATMTTDNIPCKVYQGSDIPCGGFSCPATATPTTTNDIANAVCCSPGIHRDGTLTKDKKVRLTIRDQDDGTLKASDPEPGDSITVCTNYTFEFVVGNSPSWPWSNQNFGSDVTMRDE